MGRWRWVGIVLCAGLLFMASTVGGQAQVTGMRAAAGKVDITPDRAAWMAGYQWNRRSSDAHDRLMARCLVLESGGERIAFVSCDVIGLFRADIQKMRALVKSVAADHLFINATHTHSGPDTLGKWGPDIQTRGVDEVWLNETRTKVARLVDETATRLEPATLRFADTTDVPRISKNIRVPRILDTELAVMQLERAGGKSVIATCVNYACHPEILDTNHLTADFPHWLYETVEGQTAGVCLYFNGAQGGMITADYDESTAPKGENWKAAETIGRALGARVQELLQTAQTASDTTVHTRQRIFEVPLENRGFKTLVKLGVFPAETEKDGKIETEVNLITIGPVEFLTLPGEVLPNIGLYLKRHMTGSPKFLIGLCCDELGYILTPEDYGLDLYKYETSEGVGEQMGSLMVQNLLALLPDRAASHGM